MTWVTYCLQVKPECCTDFENVWKNRNSTLLETPGFIRFALLKGDEEGDHCHLSILLHMCVDYLGVHLVEFYGLKERLPY